MALPKIDVPLFQLEMPSTKKQLSCRPFLVKEEKILLMAQQSGDDKEIISAIKQILNLCIQDKTFNPDDLTTFDLDYMFLKLRARSVDNIVKLTYRDMDDDKTYDFEVDLDNIKMEYPEGHEAKISINDEIGVIMSYPTVTMLERIPEGATEMEAADFLVDSCIDKVYDADTVYNVSEQTEDDLRQFIDGLNVDVYQKMRNFFATMPRLQHVLTYKNSLGKERKIELKTLKDFFMWG